MIPLIGHAIMSFGMFYNEFKSSHTTIEYYIPEDFHGEARIYYNQPAFPALTESKSFLNKTTLIKLMPDGQLKTSSKMHSGFHLTRYNFYDATGKTKPIESCSTPNIANCPIKDASYISTTQNGKNEEYERFTVE